MCWFEHPGEQVGWWSQQRRVWGRPQGRDATLGQRVAGEPRDSSYSWAVLPWAPCSSLPYRRVECVEDQGWALQQEPSEKAATQPSCWLAASAESNSPPQQLLTVRFLLRPQLFPSLSLRFRAQVRMKSPPGQPGWARTQCSVLCFAPASPNKHRVSHPREPSDVLVLPYKWLISCGPGAILEPGVWF